jgi:hypothetical protein
MRLVLPAKQLNAFHFFNPSAPQVGAFGVATLNHDVVANLYVLKNS